MKITITGATGFVGLNLKTYLKTSTSYVIESLSIRYLKDQKLSLKTDVVIHLAGKAHDLKKVSVPQEYYESNFELTKQLFEAFLQSEASVFIFMSTVKAVADSVDAVLTEDCKPNPKTHYGIAKNQAETYILNQKLPNGKHVYILRPCMIHGSGNKGNLNLLYQLVAKGFPWPLGAFNNQRSFLTVENLCFVIKELVENINIPNGVYNLADDESLSTNDLIKLIGVTLDKKSVIWKIPSQLMKIIAKVGDYLFLPLNSERLQKLTESYVVSNDKIKDALQKEFPVSAKYGLAKTIQSFKR